MFSVQTQMRSIRFILHKHNFLLIFLPIITIAIAACGQVITLTPTPTPAPTPTVALDLIAATVLPTSTPAPYTPEPTPTPTVTSTPVVHTIQTGESLLSIASQYGVSVAALQDANGILDPRLLQIGQQLVIPRPEEVAEDAVGTPTPTPLPVAVENIYFSETTIGGVWVLGETVNTSGVPLEQVRVLVSLLDEDDQELAQADGMIALDLLDINERAPFAILFGETSGRFEQYRAVASHAIPAYVGSYYRDLEVRNLQSEGERFASYTVSGTIYNAGPEEAVETQVVLTAYDGLGRVIAMRKVAPEFDVVPRGGETNFTAILAPVGGPVERIEAVAQGRRRSATP
jgi:LysM repeat protein